MSWVVLVVTFSLTLSGATVGVFAVGSAFFPRPWKLLGPLAIVGYVWVLFEVLDKVKDWNP